MSVCIAPNWKSVSVGRTEGGMINGGAREDALSDAEMITGQQRGNKCIKLTGMWNE